MKEVALAGSAAEWLEHCLSGGNTLARLLGDQTISSGRLWTYLPADVDIREASDMQVLRHGKKNGITAGHVEAISDMVAELVIQHMHNRQAAYAVLEDICRRGDMAISSADEQVFFYQSEVYDFLSPKDRDIEITLAHQWLSKGRQYPTVLALTEAPDIADIHHAHEVSLGVLRTFAANAIHVLVGAYDEEGYAIWTRSG